MLKTYSTALILLFFSFGLSAQFVPGELLIQLKENYSARQVQNNFEAAAGILPAIKAVRLISQPMNVWLFSFDENEVPAEEALRMAQSMEGVTVAQLNHILENRETTPDDPFFGSQWYHKDPEDNDIDSDLAWDITTGGMTYTGDEIVVCVVETGGAKWNHPDLIDNHWVNENEIPENNIDDDGNGYIDDYNGWNCESGTDVIDTGNHGTQVCSMVGAKGNNSTGISGVNWDVKIMVVQMGNITELNVIEAYTYPLVMRKKYNETNGAEGAFIVVTNSSWGTNNGQPANSPLWCAMYDELGQAGVLSCGATTNSNVNVDEVGDLPTTCPSNYLISVTSTNSSDVRTFSGYGVNSIDLAAPGSTVYLAGNSSYGNTSGTSFSSPCVAGAVALLYSADCSSLMQITYSNPALAATLVRQYIIDGVDAVSNLQTEVASGGRLNVFNSLNRLLDDCDQSPCIAPFGIFPTYMNSSIGYSVDWAVTENMQSFSFRYRKVGNSLWTTLDNIVAPPVSIDMLLPCESYEIQVMAQCSVGQSVWSESYILSTEGCCINPDSYELVLAEATEATISWNSVVAAVDYDVVVTPNGGAPVTYSNVANTQFTIPDLLPCTAYSVEVFTNCLSGANETATTYFFNTVGCLACDEIDYCSITSDSEFEWISEVQVGTILNVSANDNGYGDYTDQSTILQVGQTYTISCTPDYTSFAFSEYFKAWIDYNGNGIFEDATELIFDPGHTVTTTISGNFTVPTNIDGGSVKLRVGMSYVGSMSGGEPVQCGEFEFGETEDYCITIDPTIFVEQLEENAGLLLLYPNPAGEELRISAPDDWCRSCITEIYDNLGRVVLFPQVKTSRIFDISQLMPGVYTLRMVDKNAGEVHSARFVKE